MNQSGILRAIYETIYKKLSDLGNETDLFTMSEGGALEEPKNGEHPVLCLGVSDVSQLYPDKNGQKIQENEMLFEAPAQIGCVLFLTVIDKYYPKLLDTVGLLIQYFKDNNVIQLEDYKWHGEDVGKIVIEPVTREPQHQNEPFFHNYPAITIVYRMEMGINSFKGISFKRVEKTTLKGNIIDR